MKTLLGASVLVATTVSAAIAIAAGVTLGGVSLGEPIGSVVSAFGPPGLVETTDFGQEWRWFDQNGLDVDVLTDDALVVDQVLVSRPESLSGKTPGLVQPTEYPYLEAPGATANAAMRRSGATTVGEPNPAVSVWRIGDEYLVYELAGASVRKILALDRDAATRVGYIGSPEALGAFHAPRLIRQYAVDYPRRAVEAHASGVVVVRADISATGGVTDVRVVVSSKNADIDAAEVQSITKSTFKPAECEGQPCAGVYLDREEYSLDT